MLKRTVEYVRMSARIPCTIQDIVVHLHQYQVQLISRRIVVTGLDVEKWLSTIKVVDKLALSMRKKVQSKIFDMLKVIQSGTYDLDMWRFAYKLFHAIGDWFTLGHPSALYSYDKDLVAKFNGISENKSANPAKPVILTMTSCKRFDLLSRTIDSMLVNCLDLLDYICDWIIIDDNSSEEDRTKMQTMYPFITFIMKTPEQKGHPMSMNMLHEIVCKSPAKYNFHIEDDFEWWYPDRYIEKCMEVIKQEKHFGQALVNFEYTEDEKSAIEIWNRDMFTTKENKLRYFVHEYYDTAERLKIEQNHIAARCSMYWPHFSFRPGLTDINVYRKLGLYSTTHQHFEMDYAHRFVKAGYKTASLDCCYTTHIGRRTYERETDMLNAYDLNKEQQFGSQPKEEKKVKNADSNSKDKPESDVHAPPEHRTPPLPVTEQQILLDNLASLNCETIRMYVINLERRPERLLNFFTNNNQELPPMEVFKAVDGKSLKPSGKIQRIFETGDYNFRRGIVGCAYSHLQIWQKFMKSVSKYCVVLEDDVKLAPKFTEKLHYLLGTYTFDLMFLHFNAYPDGNRRDPTFDPIAYERKQGYPQAETWDVKKSMLLNMGSGAGYILSRAGAKHMIQFVNKYGMPNAVDWVLMKQPELKIMYSNPKLVFADCWQNNNQIQSDIQTEYDSVKYKSDMEWLQDEIAYWMKALKVSKIKLTSEGMLKGATTTYVHDGNAKIEVVDKINFKKDVQVCKEQVTIVPNHIEVSDALPVKWYTVGSSWKIVVHDNLLYTKIYNDKVWGNNRLNFSG